MGIQHMGKSSWLSTLWIDGWGKERDVVEEENDEKNKKEKDGWTVSGTQQQNRNWFCRFQVR